MKLFARQGSCSQSPHIVLRELGLDFELDIVNLATKVTQDGGDYLSINPKGSVPALQLDDGTILTEGVAIVQYLADRKPELNLIPAAGTIARYQAISWLNYISSEVHKGFSPLFNPATPAEFKQVTRERLAKQFAYLDGVLAKQSFILGEQFSVADAYLFVVLGWSKRVEVDLSGYPHILNYLEQVAARPAVQATLAAEALK